MKFPLLCILVSSLLSAQEILIDNADPKQVQAFGNWIQTDGLIGFVGTGYLHDGGAKTKTGMYVRFRPEIPADGTYEVYLHVNYNANRSEQVFVDIDAAGKVRSQAVDMRNGAKGWVWLKLGEVSLEKGGRFSVTLNTEGTEGRYVVVDALKLAPIQKSP